LPQRRQALSCAKYELTEVGVSRSIVRSWSRARNALPARLPFALRVKKRNCFGSCLRWLVDEGILERVPYQERPARYEYHLTRKGRDLHVALIGLRQWGDDYCNEKPPMLARTKSDKKPVIAALVPKRSDHLRLEEVEFVPGPGGGSR